MFINYIKIGIRNLLNKKVYSGINLLGLSIAAAFCMLVFMYMQQERSFDIRIMTGCTGLKPRTCLVLVMKNQRRSFFHF